MREWDYIDGLLEAADSMTYMDYCRLLSFRKSSSHHHNILLHFNVIFVFLRIVHVIYYS